MSHHFNSESEEEDEEEARDIVGNSIHKIAAYKNKNKIY